MMHGTMNVKNIHSRRIDAAVPTACECKVSGSSAFLLAAANSILAAHHDTCCINLPAQQHKCQLRTEPAQLHIETTNKNNDKFTVL
jgi:hypothetical protein